MIKLVTLYSLLILLSKLYYIFIISERIKHRKYEW